jgi:hypothetical protein
MLIIADAHFPEMVLKNLERFGRVLPFASHNMVYEAISGHPDIFLCQMPGALVAAPNTPAEILNEIKKTGINLLTGKLPVGSTYPASARYNAFVGSECLVHRPGITDQAIADQSKKLKTINVAQGYSRCNLVETGGLFITSDQGIENALNRAGKETFYINPAPIKLPGQKHGFFGGCAGVHKNLFFLAGSLKHFPEGSALKESLEKKGVEIVELYDGPLYDGGSILMIEPA